MKLPRLPKIDLIPGTDFDGVILGIVGLALLYVGSGGWVEQRWKEAAATAGPAAGTLIWGKRKGERQGFEKGFQTYNPALHIDEIVQRVATPMAGSVADAMVDRAVDHAIDAVTGALPVDIVELADDPRRAFIPSHETPAAPAPAAEQLPAGWFRDEAGHIRDDRGRYASEQAARELLAGQ